MKPTWHVIASHSANETPLPEMFSTETDWHRWLDSDRAIDPYLMWAELTRFEGFGGLGGLDKRREGEDFPSGDGRLPILIEFTREALDLTLPVHKLADVCNTETPGYPLEFAHFEVQAAYLNLTPPNQAKLRRRFVTGRVAPACVNALYKNKFYVRRFQLGLPRIPDPTEPVQRQQSVPTESGETQMVIGLIDDGFAFAHQQLRDDVGRCRVWALWDQEVGRAADFRIGWVPPGSTNGNARGDFGYGGEVVHHTLRMHVESSDDSDPSPYSQLQPYRALRYIPVAPQPELHATRPPRNVPDLTMLTATHGTSVADLAAGRRPPLGRFSESQGTYVPLPGNERVLVSTAAAWPLVLVQLPTRTSLDTSGGSLGVHILDGVRYIVDKAATIPPRRAGALKLGDPITFDTDEAKTPPFQHDLVINISYGATAGPHDGTSILERALEEITYGELPGKAGEVQRIVLAAGNAQGSRTHARLRMHRGQRGKSFSWYLGPDNPHESYLEIWLPTQAVGGESPLSPDDFKLWVTPPGSTADSQSICVGQATVLSSRGSSVPVAAAVFARQVAQGENGTMVLLAAAPTRPALPGSLEANGSPRDRAPHGIWTIEVAFGAASTPVSTDVAVVHAWTERNDLVYGTARTQQTWVAADDPVPPPTENAPSVREFCRDAARSMTDDAPAPFSPDFSFGSLASGRFASDWLVVDNLGDPGPLSSGAVIAVGGYRASDREVAPYSGGGPNRAGLLDYSRLPESLCTNRPVELPNRASRIAPDVDSVSDTSVANRGLRTCGTQPGIFARLGGTSAAAPNVARAIAELRFSVLHNLDVEPDPMQFTAPGASSQIRATLTPSKDDRYRRGRFRVAPQIAVRKREKK